MRYTIYTLGCKVNQFESQAMEKLLQEHGMEHCDEKADVVIVNTCAVTGEAARKSRQAIRRISSKNPGAFVAVCGCFSQLDPEETKELGVDAVFGNKDHRELVQAVLERKECIVHDDPFKRDKIEIFPGGSFQERTRAVMKIQDGCENFCSYCIIPFTRGKVRSLPVEEAVHQAMELREAGYKEIVLTGIEISSYGKDLEDKPGLQDVVHSVCRAVGDVRIHLGSIEPTVITDDFCKVLAEDKNLCRHFHLSLQSGCDKTLRDMRRKYNTDQFYKVCQRLWNYFPGCSLTADLITGFPGETEEDFRITLDFMKKCKFSFVHCFPYSVRPGTKAEKMPGQNTKMLKEERCNRAFSLVKTLEQEYLNGCIGQVYPVLFESEHRGHSNNYCVVEVNSPQIRSTIVPVLIENAENGVLYGKTVDN